MAHAAPSEWTFSAWLNRPKETDELELAQTERERSERRLEAVRERVILPIQSKGNRNQFSDHIRGLFDV